MEETDDDTHRPKAISLFSGMGGDTLGMTRAGWDVVAFSEINSAAQESHLANFPDGILLRSPEGECDVTQIPDSVFTAYRGRVDLVFAGFPCQGFSIQGQRCTDDPRNTLFKEFLRAVKVINPKYLVGENVPPLEKLINSTGEKYIDVILNEFRSIGYSMVYKVVCASHYGVPQLRKRLIMVGTRRDLHCEVYMFPKTMGITPMKTVVGYSAERTVALPKDLIEHHSSMSPACYFSSSEEPETSLTGHRYLKYAIEHNFTFRSGTRSGSSQIELLHPDKPVKTLTCSYYHLPRQVVLQRTPSGFWGRVLSTSEAKQLQGFPKDYIVCGTETEKYTQIGNAVPPALVEAIVRALSRPRMDDEVWIDEFDEDMS